MRDILNEHAYEASGIGLWLGRLSKLLGLVVAVVCIIGLMAIFS